MLQESVTRVPGFADIYPTTYSRLETVRQAVLEVFRAAAFSTVDVPVIEHLELYLRKNGAQVLPKVYGFIDQGKREIALRPEFTASVIRAYAPRVSLERFPVRLAYVGPVFRYEQLGPESERQFTQAGAEVLGDSSVKADAEIVALACQAARAAGARDLRLVLGHLGPLRAVCGYLHVEGFEEQYLLEHLEYFHRGAPQQHAIRVRLGLFSADAGGADNDEVLALSLANAVRDASPEEARSLVAALLDQMGMSLEGSTRSAEEILDRVLLKAQRRAAVHDGSYRENLEKALTFVERLGSMHGPATAILTQLAEMLAEYGVPGAALDELRSVLDALQEQDLAGAKLELAPGMARGIAYYTGTTFELHTAIDGGGSIVVCGGGRYDTLAAALTGHACSALGFAFNLEHLERTSSFAGRRPPSLRVAVLGQNDAARQITLHLRRHGFATALVHSAAVNAVASTGNGLGLGYDLLVEVEGETAKVSALHDAVTVQTVDQLRTLVAKADLGNAQMAPVPGQR